MVADVLKKDRVREHACSTVETTEAYQSGALARGGRGGRRHDLDLSRATAAPPPTPPTTTQPHARVLAKHPMHPYGPHRACLVLNLSHCAFLLGLKIFTSLMGCDLTSDSP
jgi:hypothetical protein